MIKYVDNGSVYEISENDVEMILLTAAESAEIDLRTCSQRQWKWCLQQAGKYLNRTKTSYKTRSPVRGVPVYKISDLIDIYNIYIELNNKYNKFISLEGFSYFSGIRLSVISSWSSADRADVSNIDMNDENTGSNTASVANTYTVEDSVIDDIDNNTMNNISNSNIYNSINNKSKDNIEDNNKSNNNNIRYIYNIYNGENSSNSHDDYKSRRAALYAIYSGLMSGKRECILDKAYDSNTGLSSPFLYNTEFGSYSGTDTRAALPVSGGDRQAIAARYGFQQIEQHDN
jgi:hypothetical protein